MLHFVYARCLEHRLVRRNERAITVSDEKSRAVVLLSGGLDSTTTLAIAKSEEYEIFALTFRYGQRHEFEIEAARRIAERFAVERHVIAETNVRIFGGSALTADVEV